MDHEQAFFFQVLQDYLHGSVTAKPQEAELSKVFTWAEKHKLSAIFFIQCEHFLKPDTSGFQRLHRSFGAAVAQYVARQQAGAKFRTAMDAASLPYLPIKGTWVGEAYPHPQLRTMGDLDILVHAEDSERIRDVLSPLGFQNIKWAETEWDYRLNNTLFELQAELFHTGELHNRELEAFLNDPWSWAEPTASGEYRLDQSFHFLYLIAHIAKHLRWVGVGYRQFYDLAVLMQRSRESYDWNWIREQAERLDFLRFVEICLALNERWFGVPSPYPDDALNDELFKTITAKILSDGVFGFENKDNYLQSIAAGQTDADGAGKSRWQHLRTFLFPPYRDLITSQKYAWLRGKPLLLPAAWVLRAVRGRNKQSRRQAAASYLKGSDAEIAARIVLLKELGL